MSTRCYLAGSMGGRFAEEVRQERNEATKILARYGVHAIDPAAAEGRLWSEKKTARIELQMKKEVMEAMVLRDLWLVRRCDFLLLLTGDSPSDGSWREVAYAQAIGLPVVAVSPKRCKGELMGWTNILLGSDHLFPTVEKAAQFLFKKYAKEAIRRQEYFKVAIQNAKLTVSKNKRSKSK